MTRPGARFTAPSFALVVCCLARTTLAAPCSDPCTDNNVCTVNDHCSDDLCRGAALPNGTACDDEDPSTLDDTCNAAVCEGVPGDASAPDASDDSDGADAAGPAEPSPAAGNDGGCAQRSGQSVGWWWVVAGAIAWSGWRRRRGAATRARW